MLNLERCLTEVRLRRNRLEAKGQRIRNDASKLANLHPHTTHAVEICLGNVLLDDLNNTYSHGKFMHGSETLLIRRRSPGMTVESSRRAAR